eukprot:TRINITY_DN1504_c0_g5_i1.p1 TRINITY_DN1504_c0_g5~~TRINITY_DN1504_c0_g5_i1.p1  ORF type:complete len:148 (-),score=50.69 TRINITY_DN1504_c0_g5_i1:90-533(-)
MSTRLFKFQQFLKTRPHGSIINRAWNLYHMANAKTGTFVGTDVYGNRYFENLELPRGQHRWIEYENTKFDGSQVPAEWHAWLHCTVEEKGEELNPLTPHYGSRHVENLTGTEQAYHPHFYFINEKYVNPALRNLDEFDPNGITADKK